MDDETQELAELLGQISDALTDLRTGLVAVANGFVGLAETVYDHLGVEWVGDENADMERRFNDIMDDIATDEVNGE